MKNLVFAVTFVLLSVGGYLLAVPAPVGAAPPVRRIAGIINLAIRPQLVLTTPTLPAFTATPTPSWTPTPTPTATDTAMPTLTPLPTMTVTPSVTATSTATVTSSLTATPTATATFSATASATPVQCGLPSWHPVTIPLTTTLSGVVALSPTDVWAVGNSIIHWDGQHWQAVAYPTPATSISGSFNAVAAGSATSLWAVGSYFTTYGNTLAEHWNGSAWTFLVPSSSTGHAPLAPQAAYTDVSATGPNDAYLVGALVVGPSTVSTLDHCTATGCTNLTSFDSGRLGHVSALGATDVWVAGRNYSNGTTFVSHWNGLALTTVLSSTAVLNDVAAVTPNDLWVVGGTSFGNDSASWIQHGTGSTWTTVPSPNIGMLTGVVAHTATDVWAFGHGVLHWDGSVWTQVLGAHAATVHDLSPLGPADAWTVGTTASSSPIVEHYAALPTFSDVPATDTFYPYIEWLACRTIISGYTCGNPELCDAYNRPVFRSSNGVSRGQLLKMVTLSAGWPTVTPTTPTFADVPPSSTFYTAIETGYAHGIISGYTCGAPGEPCSGGTLYFRPSASISRGQLSKVLALARAYPLPHPSTPTFADVAADNTFYGYIEAVAAHSIVSGYTCGTVPQEPCDSAHRPYFRSVAGATRGQVSKIVTLAYGGP